MSTSKSNEAPHYELLYIVSNVLAEDELARVVGTVNGLIRENGGTVTYEETWGKKRLSYPIKGQAHGYYQLVEFDASNESARKVGDLLRISNDVVRHMIVAKRSLTTQEREAAKAARQKRFDEEARAKAEQEKPKEKEPARKKVDLKDLDDKLDKILDAGDLL
jgi:small subunit ribosomal protein S6